MNKEIVDIDSELRQIETASEIVSLIDKLLTDKPQLFKRTAIYDTVKKYLKRDEVAISITYKLGVNDGIYSIDVPGKSGTTVFCAEKINGKVDKACVIGDIGLMELRKLFDD